MNDGPKGVATLLVPPDPLRVALENMRRNMDAIAEYHALDAKMKKARYDAFIAQGFTAAEALELIKGK